MINLTTFRSLALHPRYMSFLRRNSANLLSPFVLHCAEHYHCSHSFTTLRSCDGSFDWRFTVIIFVCCFSISINYCSHPHSFFSFIFLLRASAFSIFFFHFFSFSSSVSLFAFFSVLSFRFGIGGASGYIP